MSDHLSISISDSILRIALNRPEKKNALTLEMYEGMTDALNNAANNTSVRVAILHGSGGSFTAGNDLFDFLNDPPKDDTSPVFRFLRAVSTFPKPLIAAVEGHAIGIGTTVLLHCDLAYAAPSARFQLPFVNLGLVPEAASSLLLPKTVGTKKGRRTAVLRRSVLGGGHARCRARERCNHGRHGCGSRTRTSKRACPKTSVIIEPHQSLAEGRRYRGRGTHHAGRGHSFYRGAHRPGGTGSPCCVYRKAAT